jgi:hypothetical protein
MESGCTGRLKRIMRDRKVLYLFGDPAYHATFGIQAPITSSAGRRHLSYEQQRFNAHLASVRIAVEQSFGEIHNRWTYTAFGKALTAGSQPVATFFLGAVLLSNCFTILSNKRNRFEVTRLSIEEYLEI